MENTTIEASAAVGMTNDAYSKVLCDNMIPLQINYKQKKQN